MFGKKSKSLEEGVEYTVDGEDVVFQLEELNFTFEQFIVKLGDDLEISVSGEDAMNITQLAEVIDGMEEITVDPLDGDLVDFTLVLKPHVYRQIRDELAAQETLEEMFYLSFDDEQPLLDLNNYQLKSYQQQ